LKKIIKIIANIKSVSIKSTKDQISLFFFEGGEEAGSPSRSMERDILPLAD